MLVVDPDAASSELLARALAQLGHEVEVAHDVDAALRALGARPIHIAFIDVDAPGFAAHELARVVAADGRLEAVGLIGLTTRGRLTLEEQALFDAGAAKPLDLLQLVEAIRWAQHAG